MKNSLTTFILLLLLIPPAWAADSLTDLSSRVQLLEATRQADDRMAAARQKELEAQFTQLKAENNGDFTLNLLLSIGTICSGFIGFWLAFQGGKEKLKNTLVEKLNTSVSSELDRILPDKIENQTHQAMELLLERKRGHFEQMIAEYDRKQDIRLSKKIIVLVSDAIISDDMRDFIGGKYGFQHVEAHTLSPSSPLPAADLYIFDRGDIWERGHSSGQLKDEVIQNLLARPTSQNQLFLYFGKPNPAMNAYRDRLYFANNKISLPARVMEAFQYLEMTGQ